MTTESPLGDDKLETSLGTATDETKEPAQTSARPARGRALAIIRAVVAILLTVLLLPYAWGRTLVFTMLMGRPELPFMAMLAAAGLVIMVLTYHLYNRFQSRQANRLILGLVIVGWVAMNVTILALYSGDLIPVAAVIALYVPASLWIVWAAWMFYFPMRWPARIGVLVPLLVLFGIYLSLIKVDGLMGDTRFQFAWRWQETQQSQPTVTTSIPASDAAIDTSSFEGASYTQFLGPDRTGVVDDIELARDWDANPPKLLWQREVGAGWGAFAVAGPYAITQEQRGEDECVVCYRVADGQEVWVHRDKTRFDTSMGGPGPRATPTIQGDRVYTVGGSGLLNCLDLATGEPQWKAVDIQADNDGATIAHGVCASPLVVGNTVVVCPTGPDAHSLVAYDTETGERRWQAGAHPAAYSSPVLAEIDGEQQLLVLTADGLDAHDPQTGDLLWSFPWTNNEKVNVSQPLASAGSNDQVFVSTGYGKGAALVKVNKPESAEWSPEQVWTTRRMQTKFTSPVLYDGYIYGLDNGILQCVDLATGKPQWKRGRYGHGQIILVGDLLLIQAEDGDIALVEPSPEKHIELGRRKVLTGKTWNNPALAGRYLLVRNDHEAACLELPLASEGAASEY